MRKSDGWIGRGGARGWELQKGGAVRWDSIDGLAETMVNFASNRLIPGFPGYVRPISD